MAYLVAVIDLGKSNSKVALVDTQIAKEIDVISQTTSPTLTALYPSLDHEATEAFIVDALRTLSSQHSIDAITVTTHGATVALIDTNGQLAMPVLDYEYLGIDELRGEYSKHRPTFSETGSPALPGGLNIGAQLFWQQQHFPKQFSQVKTILTWPQYWVFRLTGQLYNDVTSLGCHSDLYAPRQKHYSTLINKMGWQPLLPPTRCSGEPSGTLTAEMAQRTSLPESTLVFTGIHDSNASLVPHLKAQCPPFSVVSTGTWFIAMSMGGKPVELNESKDSLLNVNAHGESVPSARFMGGRERELLGANNKSCEEGMHRLLTQFAEPPMLLPSVVSGTGPYPELSHRWIGEVLEDKDNAVRDSAIALYLALMTYECMKLIGSDGPTFVEGPMAHDSHYAQMLAVLSNQPVLISASQTGTSVGAAMLIQSPVEPPEYEPVSVDETRSNQLARYERQWQDQLVHYAM